MTGSFEQILSEESIFADRNAMSPHFVPETLPHRENEIDVLMHALAPALKGEKPRNFFLYGKTGTGKTCCSRWIMEKFNAEGRSARMCYINCRIYNTRYRVLHRLAGELMKEFDKPGYGASFFYEKIVKWVDDKKLQLVIVLDEIDMVRDLDEMVYTLTRCNDDLKKGGISMLGISNRVSFKDRLDPRSKSALYETEVVFSPYNTSQLASILRQRALKGFKPGCVDESAVNLSAAIAAQETGDARHALKLLQRAGELAMGSGEKIVRDEHVEQARRSVEEDVAVDAISTLPEHQQMVLYSVADLTLKGGKYAKLGNGGEGVLLSGEVYEGYVRACKALGREARSARWYKEYLKDLQMLGLLEAKESGKGLRGHTTLIQLSYPAQKIKVILEKTLNPGDW